MPRDRANDILKWITADERVWREVNRPLFINILIGTYADGKPFLPQTLNSGTESQIRQLIIEPFVLEQLRNNPDYRYSNDKTLNYLAWLGHNLVKRNLTQFYIEMLQGDWLSTSCPEVSSHRLSRPLLSRVTVDLGWRFEYIGFREHGCREMALKIAKQWIPRKKAFVIWLIAFPLLMHIGASIQYLIAFFLANAIFDALAILVNDLWPLGGRRITYRSAFNPGLDDAFKIGLSILIPFAVICGFVGSFLLTIFSLSLVDNEVGLTLQIMAKFPRAFSAIIISGFVPGFQFGILICFAINVLFGPWSNIIKHVLLRLIMSRKGVAPGRYDRFLQMVVNRRLMRRIGGSVFFVHRYILEYFADQWEEKYQREYDHKSAR